MRGLKLVIKKIHYNSFFLCALAVATCYLVLPRLALAQLVMLDAVVAVVDEDIVLASEVKVRLDAIIKRLKAHNQDVPSYKALYKQILDKLVEEQVQLNIAERLNVQISKESIDKAFQTLASQYKLSADKYVELLESQGGSIKSVRQQLWRDLVLSEMQKNIVNSRINITDSEIDIFLQSSEGQFWREPKFLIGYIILPKNDKVDETMKSLMSELEAGTDFRSLAIRYSKGSTALKGGDIGWRRIAEFPSDIVAAIKHLKVGQYSKPVISSKGIHLFKLHEQQDAKNQGVIEQNKLRHILIPSNALRNDAQSQDLAESLAERVRLGEDFSELAKLYSEDHNTALQGGDLGWVLPGQIEPKLEEAVQAQPVGSIIEPIHGELGWYLIWVEGRKEVDMSQDIIRNQAVYILRSQRYDEELKLWLQEIRDDAFIKIMIDEEESAKEKPAKEI